MLAAGALAAMSCECEHSPLSLKQQDFPWPWQQLGADPSLAGFAAATTSASFLAAARTKGGSSIWWARAHATFSAFVKQQQPFQHWSADAQPQGRSMQGNGFERSLPAMGGEAIGSGTSARQTPTRTARAMSRCVRCWPNWRIRDSIGTGGKPCAGPSTTSLSTRQMLAVPGPERQRTGARGGTSHIRQFRSLRASAPLTSSSASTGRACSRCPAERGRPSCRPDT